MKHGRPALLQDADVSVGGALGVPDGNVAVRAFRAGVWSFLLRGLLRGVGFIRNVALARVLAPDDIGLFGIVLVILSVVERFSTTGLQAALVQRHGNIDDCLDTVWTVHVVRGAALAAVIAATADLTAGFFNEPEAAPLIRLLAVSVALAGIQSPGLITLKRELEFRRQFALQSGGAIVELAVSVICAVALRNAWALMIGLIARRVFVVALSYWLHPYRPRLALRHDRLNELSRFGRWTFLSNSIAFLAYRGDNLLVGKLLGAPALGVYMLAYSIAEVATVEITRVANDVAFPAFSRVQHARSTVQRGVLLSLELVLCASLPVAAVMSLLSTELTILMLGHRWGGVAALLPALAVAGVMRAWVSSGLAALKGAGYPADHTMITATAVIAMYGAIFPLVERFGLVGVAWAACVGQIATCPMYMYQLKRRLAIGVAQLWRPTWPAIALTVGAVGPVLVYRLVGGSTATHVTLGVVAAAGCGAGGVAVALWKWFGAGPIKVVEIVRNKRRAKSAAAVP